MKVQRFSFAIAALLVILATCVGIVTTANAQTVCSPATAITVPYAKDGVGDVCLQATSLCNNINSWNLTTLEVNGANYTNLYAAGNSIAPLNGAYTIHYVSTVAWGHFEIDAPCSGSSPTNTPTRAAGFTNTPTRAVSTTPALTATRTNTPNSFTPTRTNTPNSFTPTRTNTPNSFTPTRTNTPLPVTVTLTRTPTATTLGPTNTPTATVVANCGSLAICDGFESQTVGGAPSGSWQVIYPDCQGTGTVVVDSAQAHAGTKSVKVDGKTGYCNHVFFGNTTNMAGIGPLVYGRVFIRPSTALGVDHVTFIAMKDVNDANKNLRFGGQGQVMAWNRESDDATVPSMSPVGISTSVALPVNQWSCLEIKVDGTNGFLQAWLNGTDIAGLTVDGVSTADIDAQWKTRTNWHPSLSDVKFGWESYSSGDNIIWFDDIAFGSSRIGCGS